MADEGKLPLKDLQEQFDEEIKEEQLKNDLNDLKRSNPRPYTQDIGMHEYYINSDYGICRRACGFQNLVGKSLSESPITKFILSRQNVS